MENIELRTAIHKDLLDETPVIPVITSPSERTVAYARKTLSNGTFRLHYVDAHLLTEFRQMLDGTYDAFLKEARNHPNKTYVVFIDGLDLCQPSFRTSVLLFVTCRTDDMPENLRFVLVTWNPHEPAFRNCPELKFYNDVNRNEGTKEPPLRPAETFRVYLQNRKQWQEYPYGFQEADWVATLVYDFSYHTLLKHLIGKALGVKPERVMDIKIDYGRNKATGITKEILVPEDVADMEAYMRNRNVDPGRVLGRKTFRDRNGAFHVPYETMPFDVTAYREREEFLRALKDVLGLTASLVNKTSGMDPVSCEPIEIGNQVVLRTETHYTLEQWLDYITKEETACEVHVDEGTYHMPVCLLWYDGNEEKNRSPVSRDELYPKRNRVVKQVSLVRQSPLHGRPAYRIWLSLEKA